MADLRRKNDKKNDDDSFNTDDEKQNSNYNKGPDSFE